MTSSGTCAALAEHDTDDARTDVIASDDPIDAGADAGIDAEIGVIGWTELVRHFARGVVVRAAGSLDLTELAAAMARDDAEALERWRDAGEVRRASDDDARDWVARQPDFRCVVVAPWVLVQELH